ncbi:hypothetical protein V8C86DRAFT_589400 [Haematococcus lacustris]
MSFVRFGRHRSTHQLSGSSFFKTTYLYAGVTAAACVWAIQPAEEPSGPVWRERIRQVGLATGSWVQSLLKQASKEPTDAADPPQQHLQPASSLAGHLLRMLASWCQEPSRCELAVSLGGAALLDWLLDSACAAALSASTARAYSLSQAAERQDLAAGLGRHLGVGAWGLAGDEGGSGWSSSEGGKQQGGVVLRGQGSRPAGVFGLVPGHSDPMHQGRGRGGGGAYVRHRRAAASGEGDYLLAQLRHLCCGLGKPAHCPPPPAAPGHQRGRQPGPDASTHAPRPGRPAAPLTPTGGGPGAGWQAGRPRRRGRK